MPHYYDEIPKNDGPLYKVYCRKRDGSEPWQFCGNVTRGFGVKSKAALEADYPDYEWVSIPPGHKLGRKIPKGGSGTAPPE